MEQTYDIFAINEESILAINTKSVNLSNFKTNTCYILNYLMFNV